MSLAGHGDGVGVEKISTSLTSNITEKNSSTPFQWPFVVLQKYYLVLLMTIFSFLAKIILGFLKLDESISHSAARVQMMGDQMSKPRSYRRPILIFRKFYLV